MIRSIQYFNEKSVAIFENLEDEFIKNPVDIASYVLKVAEELHKTGLRMIEETLNTLDGMLNESDMRRRPFRHHTEEVVKK